MGSLSLLQWIFPTQESNQGLLHCRQILYQLSYEGTQECSNYHTVAIISHASKVMLKILQARLQQYMNCEIPDVHAGFKEGRGTRDQIVIEKAQALQKNIYFCFIDYAKPLTVWITTNFGKFFKRWAYHAT